MRKQLLFILSLFALMAISFCYSQNLNRKAITDKDYFITEWEGKEIRIDKIVGENIIAQYRVKGANDWKDIVLSDNSLLVESLDNTKTYELRLLNVSRICIAKINDEENITLKRITQWGTNKWTNMAYTFSDCVNLDVTARDVPNLKECQNCKFMFSRCKKFIGNETFNNWDVSNVTDMSGMFSGSSFNQNIGKWNVANVTNMNGMFSWASYFNQPIGNWDVSNVTNMGSMFSLACYFNQDIGKWNVSNVTDMSGMFVGAIHFNQDISKWNVANVTDMGAMFWRASSFNQNIGKWNVANVTDMSAMFWGASSFNQDISKWNVSNVTNMSYMFTSASSFNQDISNWDVSNVTDMSYMFSGAYSLNQDLSCWDVCNVKNWKSIFNKTNMTEEYKPAKFRENKL